jgi:hypothetical protein
VRARQSWFSVAQVRLHGPKEEDLVVEAKGPLSGANVNLFWVFVASPEGLKLVLRAPAHDLILRPEQWGGYRTIELDSMTCCRISTTRLRFERGEFRPYRSVTKDIQ